MEHNSVRPKYNFGCSRNGNDFPWFLHSSGHNHFQSYTFTMSAIVRTIAIVLRLALAIYLTVPNKYTFFIQTLAGGRIYIINLVIWSCLWLPLFLLLLFSTHVVLSIFSGAFNLVAAKCIMKQKQKIS